MNEFLAQHGDIIILVLGGVIALLTFFIREDRKSVKKRAEENAKRISEVEKNYNAKFAMVYAKQDVTQKEINDNHKELMNAISDIKVTVARIDNK